MSMTEVRCAHPSLPAHPRILDLDKARSQAFGTRLRSGVPSGISLRCHVRQFLCDNASLTNLVGGPVQKKEVCVQAC